MEQGSATAFWEHICPLEYVTTKQAGVIESAKQNVRQQDYFCTFLLNIYKNDWAVVIFELDNVG